MSKELTPSKTIVSQDLIYRTESVTISTPIDVGSGDYRVIYTRTVHTRLTYNDGSIDYIENGAERKVINIPFSEVISVLEIAPGVMMSKAAAAGFIKAFGDTLT